MPRLDTFNNLGNANIDSNWIVENLISPGGWSFLVGQTKVGKSTLIIQLCEALQKGKDFLGLKTTQQNCLYVQADAALMEWSRQLKAYADKSSAWTAHQYPRGFLDKELERKRLHEIVYGTYTKEIQGEARYAALSRVLKGEPFTFVVFDCLQAITNRDLNKVDSAGVVLGFLDDIVTRKVEEEIERVHYLLIHHPSKSQKRGADSGAGSSSFSNLCSTKLNLIGIEQNSRGVLILEGSKVAPRQEIELDRSTSGAWVRSNGLDNSKYEELLD